MHKQWRPYQPREGHLLKHTPDETWTASSQSATESRRREAGVKCAHYFLKKVKYCEDENI